MQLWDVLAMLVDQEIRIVLTEEIEGREEEQYLTRQVSWNDGLHKQYRCFCLSENFSIGDSARSTVSLPSSRSIPSHCPCAGCCGRIASVSAVDLNPVSWILATFDSAE